VTTPPALARPARRIAAPVLALAGVAGAFAYVGAVDPNEAGHYPACPLLRLTGIYCPGCGGLRSAHAVAHGDLAAAFQDNALAVVGYALAAVLWLVWLVRAARGQDLAVLQPSARARWALGALVLAFTLLRNLPAGAFLHP
jgi:hypothetical protein